MNNINIFCFGFGQVAKTFIQKLKSENFKINLSVTSRKKTKILKFDNIKYTCFHFDDDNYDIDLIEYLKKSNYILVSIPPREGADLVIKNFSNIFKSCNIKWITYLSATSVYGNHKGEWVNEESKTEPTTTNGISRLYAEKQWMSLSLNNKKPIQIFRLSGIYSNENNILVKLKFGNVKIVNKKNHFFSRIHVEDIANILFHSLSKFKSGEIYNISDDKPATSQDVTLFGAKILNVETPKIINVQDIKNEMLKNFYKDSKKVSNKKMKNFFNYNLKFSTYEEGLSYIRSNFV